jgi:hypothetical protein
MTESSAQISLRAQKAQGECWNLQVSRSYAVSLRDHGRGLLWRNRRLHDVSF